MSLAEAAREIIDTYADKAAAQWRQRRGRRQ
jgi:hypothetical protein